MLLLTLLALEGLVILAILGDYVTMTKPTKDNKSVSKRKPRQCSRIFRTKITQCPNEAVINYVIKDDFRNIWTTYSLCRRCSPNIPLEQKKRLGDKIYA